MQNSMGNQISSLYDCETLLQGGEPLRSIASLEFSSNFKSIRIEVAHRWNTPENQPTPTPRTPRSHLGESVTLLHVCVHILWRMSRGELMLILKRIVCRLTRWIIRIGKNFLNLLVLFSDSVRSARTNQRRRLSSQAWTESKSGAPTTWPLFHFSHMINFAVQTSSIWHSSSDWIRLAFP